MFEDFFDQYASRYAFAKPGRVWCYEDGCVYRGLVELEIATGDGRWRAHLERLIAEQIDEQGNLRGYSRNEFNIDNILAGRVLFALRQQKGDRYDRALDRLADQLSAHPRTADGNYWHKKVYPHQVWLDGLYMGLPFQIEYGLLHGKADLVDDACAQMLRATDITRDARTGLYFHGFDHARAEKWANPETGLSQSIWGRANGWLSMALIDAYGLLPDGHPARPAFADRIRALADAVLAHRTQNGLWLQVMDAPSLAGNYEETSCSSMFAYFLFKSARLIGDLAGHAEDAGAALAALETWYIQRADDVWQLQNVCEVAGLGGLFGKPRDGSQAYYVSEPVVANDPKAVGPLMMAVAEKMRARATRQAPMRAGRG